MYLQLALVALVLVVSGCTGASTDYTGGGDSEQNTTTPTTVVATGGGGGATVTMTDAAFQPSTLTVAVGTEVTFQNAGTQDHWPASAIHPTHQIYPEFDSQRGIEPGESWSFTFTRAGSWRYHDHLNPSLTGTIVVE